MTDKFRDYFDEMVVYKDLKNNNFFSSLGLPAFFKRLSFENVQR